MLAEGAASQKSSEAGDGAGVSPGGSAQEPV